MDEVGEVGEVDDAQEDDVEVGDVEDCAIEQFINEWVGG